MPNYPKKTWTEEDVEKIRQKSVYGKTITCPICDGEVEIKKEEGEQYLKKKYVDTHFFLVFKCKKCGRKATKTYKKSA